MESITRLEANCVPMDSSLKELSKVIQKISLCPEKLVMEKLAAVLQGNPGLTQLNALVNNRNIQKIRYFQRNDTSQSSIFQIPPYSFLVESSAHSVYIKRYWPRIDAVLFLRILPSMW